MTGNFGNTVQSIFSERKKMISKNRGRNINDGVLQF
jgi:hypothetical protein